jgi:multidrug transporter EmrE-like cation transporter
MMGVSLFSETLNAAKIGGIQLVLTGIVVLKLAPS